jgi:hypothetical protein
MGTSVRRGKFCLDLRVGRIIDRNHIERAHWWRRISARVPRLFYSPPISPETESAVRGGEFVVNKKAPAKQVRERSVNIVSRLAYFFFV